MDEVFTVDQIKRLFESEWVLVEEPETNDTLEVQSGRVWNCGQPKVQDTEQFACGFYSSICIALEDSEVHTFILTTIAETCSDDLQHS